MVEHMFDVARLYLTHQRLGARLDFAFLQNEAIFCWIIGGRIGNLLVFVEIEQGGGICGSRWVGGSGDWAQF